MKETKSSIVVGVEQSGPEVVLWLFPVNLFWTILEPICQRHVTVSEVYSILPPCFGGYRILLRKDQAHNLTEPHVLEEKLYVDGIWRILGWLVNVIFNKIVLRDHFDVRVIGVDMHRPP